MEKVPQIIPTSPTSLRLRRCDGQVEKNAGKMTVLREPLVRSYNHQKAGPNKADQTREDNSPKNLTAAVSKRHKQLQSDHVIARASYFRSGRHSFRSR